LAQVWLEPAPRPEWHNMTQYGAMASHEDLSIDRAVSFMPHPPPDQLLEHLYLGDMPNASDLAVLRDLGITHVLNVADDVECYHPDDLIYSHMMIQDGGYDGSIIDAFPIAADFVRNAMNKGGKVLIHCAMGVNRSVTVALAVLMQLQDWSLREAYDHVKARRPCIGPFTGNQHNIATWELEMRSQCTMPEWLLQDSIQQSEERDLIEEQAS